MNTGSYSGTNYDRWSYEQAAKGGTLADTPINRLQHKFWVARQAVGKKLGKEEDEHIVASDSQLDAKLELFKSINETTCRLQRLIERYQDRLYYLAGEENALGRFLKEEGKNDKTRAGKMMIAAGKTMSYTGQQRLAIRVPLVRLYQEVETFRQRAIEDMWWTVDNMEKVRTEYRGALLWMKNVSTELDPDTFRQLEKFRKVQIHVKDSKKRFDKLAVDCLQKIDLLAASRCNMFSHALILYQNTLVTFWEKTAKTMNHVNNGFKGYQHYEFSYIKDLAQPRQEQGVKKEKLTNVSTDESLLDLNSDTSRTVLHGNQSKRSGEDQDSLHNLLLLSEGEEEGAVSSTDGKLTGSALLPPTLDDDDEILLRIENELTAGEDEGALQSELAQMFLSGGEGQERRREEAVEMGNSQQSLDMLLGDEEKGTFTKEWEDKFTSEMRPDDEFSDFVASKERQSTPSSFMPSQLFDLNSLYKQDPAPQGPLSRAPIQPAQRPVSGRSAQDMSQWFSLFADLDPLANPDSVGRQNNRDCL